MATSKLYTAIKDKKSIEKLQQLIKDGCNVNARNPKSQVGNTLLIEVVNLCVDEHSKDYAIQVLKLLLENGADPNIKNQYGIYPLLIASEIEYGEDIVKLLIDYKSEVNAIIKHKYKAELDIIDNFGKNALHFCFAKIGKEYDRKHISTYKEMKEITQRYIGTIKTLLDAGININGYDSYRNSTFVSAVSNVDSLEIVKLMLKYGADINATDDGGSSTRERTAFMCAVDNGNMGIMKFLLKQGIDINFEDNLGYTAIFDAIEKNDLKFIKFLIDNGADINHKNAEGNTPFMEMGESIFQPKEIYKYLLSVGMDTNIVNNDNENFLHRVLRYSFADIKAIEVVFKLGTEVNLQNIDGDTPLIFAVDSTQGLNVYELLLKNGASIDIQNNKGQCALSQLLSYNPNTKETKVNFKDAKIVEAMVFFLERGANPNFKFQDKNGKELYFPDVVENSEAYKYELNEIKIKKEIQVLVKQNLTLQKLYIPENEMIYSY